MKRIQLVDSRVQANTRQEMPSSSVKVARQAWVFKKAMHCVKNARKELGSFLVPVDGTVDMMLWSWTPK